MSMRSILGGLFVLFALLVSSASAQITGKVESIGFGGEYRAGSWTPMLIRLTPVGAPTDFYEVRIWQHDLDGDLPYYTTRISLTAGAGEQPFWTYFIPEPIRGGMTSDLSSAAELAQRLRITIHDKNGKELVQLPLGNATARSVDASTGFDRERGSRFVLFVGTNASPPIEHYAPKRIVGIQENLYGLRTPIERLPENVIGYDGVDAIVWLDGDPAQLDASGGRRFDALRDFVRRGGHLVICTPVQWQQLAGFQDLLPVDITGIESNTLQSPLREITASIRYTTEGKRPDSRNPWNTFRSPISIATATAHSGSIVERWSNRVENPDPHNPDDHTPWLVRKAYGFGCVSWVAQDLGQRDLVNQANWGWPAVWELILGAQSRPLVDPNTNEQRLWNTTSLVDIGFTAIDGMKLSGRGAKLIGVTVLFFIGYWIIVGPGAFFWLRYKGQSTLNWFVFGALALVATALTLGMVRLVLRGDAEMKHVSLVRIDCERKTPASVVSALGIYVPRDGAQRIEVGAGEGSRPAGAFAPTLTPFPIHPIHHRYAQGDNYLYAAPRQYRVNIPTGDVDRGSVAVTDVPFRTTMKRVEARWSGHVQDRIDGAAKLAPVSRGEGYIAGVLTNVTGKDLRNIYVAFRHQLPGGDPVDWMMYVATWKAGEKLDLAAAFNPPKGSNKAVSDISVGNDKRLGPNAEFPVRGRLQDWQQVLSIRGDLIGIRFHSDLDASVPVSVPMLSFFTRLPMTPNPADATDRSEYWRNGMREWDASSALMAGKLVILAQLDNAELPLPLTIDGYKPSGRGKTIYQFILPLEPLPADISPIEPATTEPATQNANPNPTTGS